LQPEFTEGTHISLMPNRIIRDGILSSARMEALSIGAEVFFRRLLSVVDDYGRYHASPVTLIGGLWPTRPEKVRERDVAGWMAECAAGARPLIRLYTVDGARYLVIPEFGQKIRSRSKFPDPDSNLSADCGQSDSITSARGSQNVAPSRMRSRMRNAKTEANTAEPPDDFESWVETVLLRHPKPKNRTLAEQALVKLAAGPGFDRVEFDRIHQAWCSTESWTDKAGAFCPVLAEWIDDKGYLRMPPQGRAGTRESEIDASWDRIAERIPE
jgi:hypothetical protein